MNLNTKLGPNVNAIQSIDTAINAKNDSYSKSTDIEEVLAEKAEIYANNAIANMIDQASNLGLYYTFVYIPKDIYKYVKNILLNNFYNFSVYDAVNNIYRIDWTTVTKYTNIKLNTTSENKLAAISLLIPMFKSNTFYNSSGVLVQNEPENWSNIDRTSGSSKILPAFRNYYYDKEHTKQLNYNFYQNTFYTKNNPINSTINPIEYNAVNSVSIGEWNMYWDIQVKSTALTPENNYYYIKEII